MGTSMMEKLHNAHLLVTTRVAAVAASANPHLNNSTSNSVSLASRGAATQSIVLSSMAPAVFAPTVSKTFLKSQIH